MTTETIHIALLDEGITVWRPAEAEVLGDGKYRIIRSDDYDPEDEAWEFPPGVVVRCTRRILEGESVLVASQRAT